MPSITLTDRFRPWAPGLLSYKAYDLIIPKLGITIPKMGTKKRKQPNLAGALFSQVQLRVLALLIGQPDRSFHATEVIRLAGSGSGAVQRQLEKLDAAGILKVTFVGARKIYQANRQCPIFDELYSLMVKTVGLIEPLRRALRSFEPNIEIAFVYGSVAKGEDTAKSDIDLMVIGKDLAYGEVYAALQKAEKILRRPVNPNLMTAIEWKRKLSDKSAFVTRINQQSKLFIFGSENDLKGIR